jgi:hypothetical protein
VRGRTDIECSYDYQFSALAFTIRVNLGVPEYAREPIFTVQPVALDRASGEVQSRKAL